jgi:hypothetical protein
MNLKLYTYIVYVYNVFNIDHNYYQILYWVGHMTRS